MVLLTLTIAKQQTDTDQKLKRDLLNRFLIWLQREYPGILYLWKAEKQQNGNIHFHIIVNRFLPWQHIRQQWNQILRDNGYVSHQYLTGHGLNPNSIDLEAIEPNSKMTSYIAKYAAKQSTTKQVLGKVWGCSRSIANYKSKVSELAEQLWSDILETAQAEKMKIIVNDFCTVICGNIRQFLLIRRPELVQEIERSIQTHINRFSSG